MLGTFVLSAEYYDAYYTKAQKVRRLIRDKTEELLAEYDFIMGTYRINACISFGTNKQRSCRELLGGYIYGSSLFMWCSCYIFTSWY